MTPLLLAAVDHCQVKGRGTAPQGLTQAAAAAAVGRTLPEVQDRAGTAARHARRLHGHVVELMRMEWQILGHDDMP